MTAVRVAILNEYNRLIEACNNDEIKKQLYTLSNKFMATQQEKQDGLWTTVEHYAEIFGVSFIEDLLTKLIGKKQQITSIPTQPTAQDIHDCPAGQKWSDIAGKCVPDIG